MIASLRKRRADRVKDQAFAPPSTYMWSRPPPMMYPPSWQAQPPYPPPQQQEKDKASNKDTEMMKLKLEKLEEERKRRELAVELERQKMEEKFERLKEEHEETLMKHEVAVMNAKAKSADIVEDAAKLLREEQKKNQLYRTEMQQMEKRLREEKSNMAAIQSSTNRHCCYRIRHKIIEINIIKSINIAALKKASPKAGDQKRRRQQVEEKWRLKSKRMRSCVKKIERNCAREEKNRSCS